jgi:menaquinol-cytochrome c reductase iron-sulfur subunit
MCETTEPRKQYDAGAANTLARPAQPSRRTALLWLGVLVNAAAGALLTAPIVGYLVSPARRDQMLGALSWVSLGAIDEFPVGETRLSVFRSPFTRPWDGETAKTPCWVRRITVDRFQVFAVNCAHLGCPVRWFPQSSLFLCPCHGGAYYADGTRASGPPERGLFEYPYRIREGRLWIRAGIMPTPGPAQVT